MAKSHDDKVTLDDGRTMTYEEAVNSVQNGYIDKVHQGSGQFERAFMRDEDKDYEQSRDEKNKSKSH